MASSGLHQQLCCPVCEESYDEKKRLPKVFPCQHSVCMSCLHEMIRTCDEAEVECPLCRGRTAIPSDGAAAFPNNLTLLSILDMMQVQAAPSKCPVHPTKRVCGACVQCWQVVCLLCAREDHADHEVDDVDSALDMCIVTAQSTLQDIITEYTAITDTIKQKAKRKDFSCFSLLRDLQNIKTEVSSGDVSAHPRLTSSVGKTASSSARHMPGSADSSDATALHSVRKLPPPDPTSLASNVPGAVGGIVETHNLTIGGQSMNPDAINTDLLQFHSSTKLPDFRLVDMNRRNKLLLVFPDNEYAIYDVLNQNRKMDTLCLYRESLGALKLADHVVLSLDNNIAIPSDGAVFCGNVRHSLKDQFHCKILFARESDFYYSYENGSNQYVRNYNKESKEVKWRDNDHKHKLGSNVLFLSRQRGTGYFTYSDGIIQTECNCWSSVYKLIPEPTDMQSGAAVGEKLVLMVEEEGKTIDVYILQEDRVCIFEFECVCGRGGNHYCNCPDKNKCSEYEYQAHRIRQISIKELGLGQDCKIKRIWTADAPAAVEVLHVLYTSSPAKQQKKRDHQQPSQYSLASYTITKNFIDLEKQK